MVLIGGLPKYTYIRLIKLKPFSTQSSLLSLCRSSVHLKQTHANFIHRGLHENPVVASELIDSYSNLGLLHFSVQIFYSATKKSKELYDALLRNLTKYGEFRGVLSAYRTMALDSVFADEEETYPLVLGSCSSGLQIANAKTIHGHVIKLGLESLSAVEAAVTEMYNRFGEFHNGRDGVHQEKPNLWNGNPVGSFQLRGQMGTGRLETDFVSQATNLLRFVVDLGSLRQGMIVHCWVYTSGLCSNLSVSTALLSMYVKLRDLHNAGKLFDKMPEKDCVVWNIMISAYSHNGYPEKSVQLLRGMVKSGTRADLFTALPAASSIGQLKSSSWCKELHTYVSRNELGYQVSVHNALIDMYCDCGCLDYARKIFNSIADKTVVSWSTLMKGYVKHDHSLAALSLFSSMNLVGPRVDFIAIINILPACVNTGALEQVKSLHCYSVKLGLNMLSALNTALLTSYAKCGSMDMARKIFFIEENINRDIIIWNSMITSHAKHGDWSQCFELYNQMKHSNLKPDEVTFLGLLTACVNSGLVKEGRAFFKEMTETYHQRPSQEHYACMVDLLGRAGHVDEAKELVKSMAFKPDARVWGPLLSACKLHPNTTELAEFAADNLISAEPRNAGNYILLSNIYAAAGQWDGVAKMRSLLRDKGMRKTPGCSWVEINGQSHEFRVADRSHSKADSIYGTLSSLEMEIKAARDEFEKEANGLAEDFDLLSW